MNLHVLCVQIPDASSVELGQCPTCSPIATCQLESETELRGDRSHTACDQCPQWLLGDFIAATQSIHLCVLNTANCFYIHFYLILTTI